MTDGPQSTPVITRGPVPDKSIPHSSQAEEAVLGSVLINPDALYDLMPILRPDDFYIVRNAWIFEVFVGLHDRREPIDYVTVVEELERLGRLAEVGGPAYVSHLVNIVPTAVNAEAYGHIIEQMAVRRRLITAAGQIAQLAYEEEREIGEVIDRSEQSIFAISERRISRELRPIKQVIHDYYDRMAYLRDHQGEIVGVPTGFIDLDKLLGGLQRSDMVIIAARPGMGKTSLVLSLALNAARKHQRVAMFSLEMAAEQIVARMVSAETRLDSSRLRLGDLNEDEWDLFTQATARLADLNVFIDDTPSITPLQLRTKCRRLYAEYGLDLVIVDYVQLMTGEGRSENRVQEVSYISRSVKALARELSVPVIAVAQLSRSVEQRQDKRPILSDLRESGCLAGESQVTLARSGANVPIRDLAGQSGFCVWALNPQSYKLEAMPVSRAFSTGTRPTYRLTTRLGRTIRATANHRFLTIGGWKRLDELNPGDYLALPRELSQPAEQSMPNAELALLGHLIGDGCTLPRHAIQYTTREQDLAEGVAALAQHVFGDDVRPRVAHERNWYQVYLASTRHHTHGVHAAAADWLSSLGVWGFRSHEKRVPEEVFRQPSSAVAHFLRHLWATDGSIQLVKGKRTRPIAYYASSSLTLAENVQSLLLRLGINARLQCIPQTGKGRDQYHVVVTGKPDLERFAQLIGAVGEYRQGRLAEVSRHLNAHSANTNRDVIPAAVWRQYVVPAMQESGLTNRQMQAACGHEYCGTRLYTSNLSRERAARVARVVKSAELSVLAKSDVYWDGVVSIAPAGEEEVFDLTVPGHHNFVANNIILHNSLEQDADVVMFIHREEMYDPETERKNMADIIIAKHRNGPTGDVELFFDGAHTQFHNAVKSTHELSY